MNIEVLNAGVIGFGPDQSLIRFQKEVNKYKPDLVIFHIFADNDFGDIIKNRLFNLDKKGTLKATKHKKIIDEHLLTNKYKKQKSSISSLLTIRAFKKLLFTLLPDTKKKNTFKTKTELPRKPNTQEIIDGLIKKSKEEFLVYKESKPRQFSVFGDHYDIDIALDPNQESARVKIDLMQAILREGNNLAASNNIKFIVLIQPSVVDLTEGNSDINHTHLQKYPNYKRTNLTNIVEQICIKNNIHKINLFPIFKKNNPENLFFTAGDNHWTDLGQRLAAKETAQFIIDYQIIK